jgi:hypothetical protein
VELYDWPPRVLAGRSAAVHNDRRRIFQDAALVGARLNPDPPIGRHAMPPGATYPVMAIAHLPRNTARSCALSAAVRLCGGSRRVTREIAMQQSAPENRERIVINGDAHEIQTSTLTLLCHKGKATLGSTRPPASRSIRGSPSNRPR